MEESPLNLKKKKFKKSTIIRRKNKKSKKKVSRKDLLRSEVSRRQNSRIKWIFSGLKSLRKIRSFRWFKSPRIHSSRPRRRPRGLRRVLCHKSTSTDGEKDHFLEVLFTDRKRPQISTNGEIPLEIEQKSQKLITMIKRMTSQWEYSALRRSIFFSVILVFVLTLIACVEQNWGTLFFLLALILFVNLFLYDLKKTQISEVGVALQEFGQEFRAEGKFEAIDREGDSEEDRLALRTENSEKTLEKFDVRNYKFYSFGQQTGGIAHDFNFSWSIRGTREFEWGRSHRKKIFWLKRFLNLNDSSIIEFSFRRRELDYQNSLEAFCYLDYPRCKRFSLRGFEKDLETRVSTDNNNLVKDFSSVFMMNRGTGKAGGTTGGWFGSHQPDLALNFPVVNEEAEESKGELSLSSDTGAENDIGLVLNRAVQFELDFDGFGNASQCLFSTSDGRGATAGSNTDCCLLEICLNGDDLGGLSPEEDNPGG